MNDKSLLLFQMGPVQEFIAQAAMPTDLWAGSYLLSSLIFAGLKKLVSLDGVCKEDVVFPNLTDSTIAEALDEGIPTLPNRFLAFVPSGREVECAEAVKCAIRAELSAYVEEQVPGFRRQTEQFPQLTYAILKNPPEKMGEAYKEIGKRLAARRNVREFDPWREDLPGNGAGKTKDFLTGKEVALKDGLGAMNLIKRTLEEKFMSKVGDYKVTTEDDPYLAVIAMDGDTMGATLSGFSNADDHRKFSTALAKFACSVREPIESDFNGCLVYAGGDDVLAVVPATKAIACADALQKLFKTMLSDYKLHASAGIAVGHDKTPLQDVILAAHKAEHRAKHVYGRDALAISVFKRSGEVLEWGCKWNSKGIPLFEELKRVVNKNRDKEQGADAGALLSARFPYKLAGLLEPYDFDRIDNKNFDRNGMLAVVAEELKFALAQSKLSAESTENVETLAKRYLEEVFTEKEKDADGNEADKFQYSPKDFLQAFLCETFIDRPRDMEDR